MESLFQHCESLSHLNILNFKTSNVINMKNMFDSCINLTSLDFDLILFNTHLVTNMEYMFNNCKELDILDVSKFDTSLVTNMRNMFQSCKKLTSIFFSNKYGKYVS